MAAKPKGPDNHHLATKARLGCNTNTPWQMERTKIKGVISKIEIVRRNVTTDIIILYVGIKYVDFNWKSLKVN